MEIVELGRGVELRQTRDKREIMMGYEGIMGKSNGSSKDER